MISSYKNWHPTRQLYYSACLKWKEKTGFFGAFAAFFKSAYGMFSLILLALAGASGCAHTRPANEKAGWAPSPTGAGQVQYPARRIAVIPFESMNPYVPGTNLSDCFVVQIMQNLPDVQVIERKDLIKILAEQKLTLTGVIRSERFSQLGSILGVDAILVGSVETLETIQSVTGSIAITVKLMEVSTGRILWADRQTITHATWSVREVPEVAATLMEKGAKKMVGRMEKTNPFKNLSNFEFTEKKPVVQEARLSTRVQ